VEQDFLPFSIDESPSYSLAGDIGTIYYNLMSMEIKASFLSLPSRNSNGIAIFGVD
jgi:hypothetical protein